VRAITGISADEWNGDNVEEIVFALHESLSFAEACRSFARIVHRTSRDRKIEAAAKPWGVLIASQFSRAGTDAALQALKDTYPIVATHEPIELLRRPNASRGGKLMYRITLGTDDRSSANRLCNELRREGGACVVVRN
jgi:hypothetical protein